MLTMLIIAALSITGSEQAEPVYVLEYPGLAFGYLPDEMNPPIEGTLSLEGGVITGAPNSSGTEYQLHYWQEDLEPNSRKDIWLSERFRNIISPDLLSSLLISNVEWIEGSTASPYRETGSVGLVPYLNFNVVNDSFNITGKGMACAIFTEGYSILFFTMTPGSATIDVKTDFDEIVSHLFLAEE